MLKRKLKKENKLRNDEKGKATNVQSSERTGRGKKTGNRSANEGGERKRK